METAKTTPKEGDLKQIMTDIESKTENMVLLGYKTGQLVTPDKIITSTCKPSNEQLQGSIQLLQGIMQQGSNEFEKRVGRPMTYSEMRQMYG